MSGAPDINAQYERLRDYVLSLRNTQVDPDEPLVSEVYWLPREGRNDNGPHQSPRVGIRHEGSTWPKNNLIGGGNSQEGSSIWQFVVLVDSPIRDEGMIGPRGACVITKLLIDGLTGFSAEADGSAPFSITNMIQYNPFEADVKPECGYYIEANHSSTNEE